MSTDTHTRTAFIVARLREDELCAKQARPGPWWPASESVWAGEGAPHEAVCPMTWGQDANHIARHDPLRTLDAVAAMWRIFDLASQGDERVLDALADVWADHPDWRENWSGAPDPGEPADRHPPSRRGLSRPTQERDPCPMAVAPNPPLRDPRGDGR